MPRGAFFLLIPVLLMDAASFLRAGLTGSVKVSQNYPTGWGMLLIVLMYFLSLGMAGIGYYKVVFRKEGWDLSLRQTRNLAVAAALLSFFMLPLVSNDIFGMISYGDVAVKGISPYADGSVLREARFHSYVGDAWKSAPCVYGPVNLVLAMAAVYPASADLLACITLYKLLLLAFSIIFILFVCRYIEEFGGRQECNIAALLVFSPILWLHGSGHAHNDIVAGALVAAAVYSLRKGWFLPAATLLTLGALAKTIPVILLVMYFMYLVQRHRAALGRMLALGSASMAVIVILTVGAYYPFWEGLPTVTTPLRFLADKKPARTPVEVLSVAFAYAERGPAALSGMVSKGLEQWRSTEDRRMVWAKRLIPLFRAFALVMALLLLARLRGKGDFKDHLDVFASITLVVMCFYSQVCYPGYLMMALPLFLETGNKGWIAWLVVFSVWGNTLNVVNVCGRASWLSPLVSPFFVVTIVSLYFWRFRERFFPSP